MGEISRESGYMLAQKAFQEGTLAEAVLLGSDEVAEGALEAFRDLELRVPKDVAVIIYQDIQTLKASGQMELGLRCFRIMSGKTRGDADWADRTEKKPGSDGSGAYPSPDGDTAK